MSFIEKLKTFFNIGGIEMHFDLERNIPKQNGEVAGKLILQADGERKIKNIYFTLEQREEKERNGGTSVRMIPIGSAKYNIDTLMKAGTKKTVDFVIPFQAKKNLNEKVTDALMDKGGLLSMVGAIGSFVGNIQITYYLKAKVEIEGALFKPEELVHVKLL